MRVIAHRGCTAVAPENTIAAFAAAADREFDGVEMDVHVTADGVPVVIHDALLDRTTSGTGPVALRSASYVTELDAGAWYSPEFTGERVPALAAALTGRWAERISEIHVEVKAPFDAERFDLRKVWWSSFDSEIVVDLPEPRALICRGERDCLARARMLNCQAIHAPVTWCLDRSNVEVAHSLGLLVRAWVVRDPRDLHALTAARVDGAISEVV